MSDRSSPSRRTGRALAALAVLALGGAALAPVASTRATGKAPALDLLPQSASGKAGVTVAAIVRTAPYTGCRGTVTHDGVTRSLGSLRTARDDGAGRWQWVVARGVQRGWWAIEATCYPPAGATRATARIKVGAGPPGRHVRGQLFAPRSLRSDDHGTGSGGGGNPYRRGECTWWAWRKRQDLPYFPGIAGDALNWATSAARRHIPVGTRPVVGAIAVFRPFQRGAGYLGHVAYVEAVNGDTVTISEAGFAHFPPGHRRTVSAKGLTFIYGGPAGDGKGDDVEPIVQPRRRSSLPLPAHRIARTCANGACGVIVRNTPYGPVIPMRVLHDGDGVSIECQTLGDPVTGLDGTGSSVWDRVGYGNYVPDYYVDPGGTRGYFSATVGRCPDALPFPEQEGHLGTDTYIDQYATTGQGKQIPPGQVVRVACKVWASQLPYGYWYRIATEPWYDLYAPANTFMNGDPWSGPYFSNTDYGVSDCSDPPPPPQSGTDGAG